MWKQKWFDWLNCWLVNGHFSEQRASGTKSAPDWRCNNFRAGELDKCGVGSVSGGTDRRSTRHKKRRARAHPSIHPSDPTDRPLVLPGLRSIFHWLAFYFWCAPLALIQCRSRSLVTWNRLCAVFWERLARQFRTVCSPAEHQRSTGCILGPAAGALTRWFMSAPSMTPDFHSRDFPAHCHFLPRISLEMKISAWFPGHFQLNFWIYKSYITKNRRILM